MTKLTYTLAIINGTVCYECQPSTPHAFYSGGGWFAPFCTVLELTRKNTVKAYPISNIHLSHIIPFYFRKEPSK